MRYAIYYAPHPASLVDRFGRRWLGRDAYSGVRVKQPDVPGIPSHRMSAITRSPGKYGFHGTLKPPFAMASGQTAKALFQAAEGFVRKRQVFYLPPLTPVVLDGFIALIPKDPCTEMQQLADDCVRFFDLFRAPSPAEEMDRRRANGLTDSQEFHLNRWGYPYVMSDFRFHHLFV